MNDSFSRVANSTFREEGDNPQNLENIEGSQDI
jgi:hypothetical protein